MEGYESQNIEEQNLWNSFIQGDDVSLEMLYRRYFDELYNYGKKWLNDTELTEDSIQDLFVKLMRNRANLATPVAVKYYLFRSFRTIVLDKMKSRSKRSFVDEPGDHHFPFALSPERLIIDEENEALQRQKLTAAMQALTPRQREAIFLRYVEDFSYKQVAEMMDLTAKGTYKLMARAIESLKEQMLGAVIFLVFKIIFCSIC